LIYKAYYVQVDDWAKLDKPDKNRADQGILSGLSSFVLSLAWTRYVLKISYLVHLFSLYGQIHTPTPQKIQRIYVVDERKG
jgi:hypothetical protein